MSTSSPDHDLLALLNKAADSVNYSPEALIELGVATAQGHKRVVLDASSPWPEQVEEAEIAHQHLAEWPDWVHELVAAGCRWERLQFSDGSHSVRLITKAGRVLAGQHFQSVANE